MYVLATGKFIDRSKIEALVKDEMERSARWSVRASC